MKCFYAIWAIALAGCLMMAGKAVKVSVETLSPSEIITTYYNLALEGKIDEAMTLWTNQCVPSNGVCANSILVSGEDTHREWTKIISESKPEFKGIEYEKINGESASVLVYVKYQNGIKSQTIYKLVKQKETWKIQTISSPALEEADSQIDYSRLGID